ncbi:MAG: glycosyltransferase [Hyphomonadaceae bacterium]|nr:glycosyltransferase [Hyphomonadaceae bacterium]
MYDAEDRPDPRQLRAAAAAFAEGPANLAVVQAPLVIWNHTESWIAAQFAVDYAIWFRVMLPFLARLSPILPLGGTSNHFRTEALRNVGGWDPFNVTEDADLGIRLGRMGYRAGLIEPPTYEEAPPKTLAWIKQRGRWIQGHIQTVSLHMRQPALMLRQIGARGFFTVIVGLGLGPMAAIFALPLQVHALYCLGNGHADIMDIAVLFSLAAQVFAGLIAIGRDGRKQMQWAIFSQPIYVALQSLAAARAIWRVVFTPSFWDKTDHGCAARS